MSDFLNPALTVLSNAGCVPILVDSFHNLSDVLFAQFKILESCSDFFLKDVKKSLESVHMVFLLLHHMQCTPTKPHNESLALHTLWLLVIHSKRTLQTAGLLQAIEYVQITHDIGVALNIRLEEET